MSTSSPLYPFNIWDDTNVYFTMGRVVLGGMVPYRDVYEQKGPIWFFIQALCALISDNSFIGVYILETVMCSLFIIFSWKITKLFISIEEHEYYVLGVMILSGIIYSSNMFHLGGSTEEFAFPLLAIVMYIALKALIQDKTLPSVKEALIVGLITGSLFWIKFTLCAFIVGFVFFFFVYAITIKKNRELLRLICTFLIGFIIVTIPILIYYGINSAINDLINVYFIDNIVVHSGINTTGNDYLLTLIHKLKLFTVGFGILYKPNIALLFLILISVILFSIYKKRITVYLLLSYSITHLVCFMKDGVIIFYYGFPLVVFSALTLIPITLALKIVNERLKAKTTIASTVLISAVIVCFVSCILNSKNTTLLGKPYEETPQYIFSQEITKTDNPRILTYDVMDSGFLTASGALPSNRFYCSLIILNHLPEAQQERDHLIEDGYFDYIVAYRNDYEWNNYEVISSAEYAIPYPSGNTYSQVYYLYKRDDLI
ncbi:MAG: glycosyltransferase family 39 protein [Clostridiales bacterium]|nr:glycosyltransferase family 39 protein [Clostridiales bacterium]